MAPRTVQQLFGLKPEELNALTILAGLEGYRGGAKSPDVAAVAANTLSRRLSGRWGGIDIRNIATAPGQYEAIYAPGYTMQNLGDPAFGARVLGGQAEFERLRNIVNDPSLVGQQFIRSRGAQSFRGVAGYGNRKPGDYMPVPGRSNFYFDPLDPERYKRGLNLFGNTSSPRPTPPATSSATPGVSSSRSRRSVEDILGSALGLTNKPGLDDTRNKSQGLVGAFRDAVIENMLQPILNPFGIMR